MRPEHPHAMCRLRFRHPWLRQLRRRWPLWLLFIGLLVLVLSRFVQVKQMVATVAQSQWQWMLAATLLQALYYALYAALLQSGFATVGVESRLRHLVPVLFTSIFVGTVTPAGGVTAAAVLIDDAARRQQSPARAAEGVLLVWVAGLAAAVPVLLAGLGYLYSQHALQAHQVVGALAFLLYTGSLTTTLLLAMWQPHRLRHLLQRLQRPLNRLRVRLRRPPLPADWAGKNAAEAAGAAIAVATRPGKVGRTLVAALATHLVSLACLDAIFVAFHHAVSVGVLAAGFSLAYVFSVISILPFDVGVAEGIMAMVYASLGVPAATALVIALAFRGLNTWLPIAFGFFMFRLLWRKGESGRP